MLNNLSEQIRKCLEHAEECAREAAAQPKGSPSKQDYLNLEKRWLGLARSFELGEQLTDFTNEAKRRASAPITPFLQGQALDPETVQAVANALVMTCEALGLSNRDDAMTQLVAEKIIELAKRGLKNPRSPFDHCGKMLPITGIVFPFRERSEKAPKTTHIVR